MVPLRHTYKMALTRYLSSVIKKCLCRRRYIVVYVFVVFSCFSLRFWSADVLRTAAGDPLQDLEGFRDYLYLQDSSVLRAADDRTRHVWIHSAFLDSRSPGGGHSLIRIFAHAHSPPTSSSCCFELAGFDDSWICSRLLARRKTLSSTDVVGIGSDPERTIELMFSCQFIHDDLIALSPKRVVLAEVKDDVVRGLSAPQTISAFRNATATSGFAVCLVASTRSRTRFSTSQDLVEYFELLKLLGASHVISYQRDDLANSILNRIRDISPRIVSAGGGGDARSLTIARNDCLYRSMTLAEFALFLDLNEILVPRSARDWSRMVDSLRRVHNTTKVGAYVLQVFNFYDETTNATTAGFAGVGVGVDAVRSLRHLPRVVRFRTREGNVTADRLLLAQPAKVDHVTGSGSVKMLPGYINVNVPVDYAVVHRFIHDRHIYKGLTVDDSKDIFVPVLMRRLYSLGKI